MRVTAYYDIPRPVPFLDVDVSSDKPMFVDPRAIRLTRMPQPFADHAVAQMESFFHKIAACALSNLPADHHTGLQLLQRFEEPWETRLGYAAEGFSGHGGADDVGEWIWGALSTDARMLVDVGILTQIEDVPLFVDGVAEDITSDLTTRIIFESLAQFTAQMLAKYPQFHGDGHATVKVERQIWDSDALAWTLAEVELPVAQDKELLLVPRDWARGTLLVNAGRFYGTKVLGYAQLEQATRDKSGKLITTPKDLLAKQEALARGRETILEVVLRAKANGENLVKVFKSFVDSRFESLPDDYLDRKLA